MINKIFNFVRDFCDRISVYFNYQVMKSKLRKINVGNRIFYWRVGGADEEGYILLKIWIPDLKHQPWITVKYRYDDPWINFGDIVAARTDEQKDKLKEIFQFNPMTPKKVATAILFAIQQIENKYPDTPFVNRNLLFRMEGDGSLFEES